MIPLVGWVAGVVLLWASPRWRWGDKLVGAAVWPGGLLIPALFLIVIGRWAGHDLTVSSGLPGRAVAVLLITAVMTLAPFAVAAWLLHRART